MIPERGDPSVNCRHCLADLPAGSAFCLQCGTQVDEVVAVADDQLLVALKNAVGSQYEIVRLLGRGGMGAVYLARDRALDRLVAIKVLPPGSTDTENTERFRREARTAARLTHPNIVPLYTFGEGEGILYFVMGYVSGESLRDQVRRLGRLEPSEARRILVDVAGALQYAHHQGVVHRDVKPDNILLEDETGKPMLTDFGVAKSAVAGETLTKLGTALGTPYYMSPEQAAGEREVDGRSDLYSLAVIGYQMLAGQLPFEGDSVREILLQHMTKEAIPLKSLAPSAPPDLTGVISRCLMKNPDDRVPDAEAFKRELGLKPDTEEEDLPENLAELVRLTRSIPWVPAGFWYVAYWVLLWGDAPTAAGLFAIGALFPPMIEGQRRREKLTEHSWRSIFKRAFRKPKLWSIWWPKAWRGPDDTWERLPKPVRWARVALSWMFAIAFMAIPPVMRSGFGAPSLFWVDVVMPAFASILIPSMGLAALQMGRAYHWSRKAGLKAAEFEKFLAAPDSETRFWNQPHIQRLLAPAALAGTGAALPLSQTPQGYVKAIEDAVKLLDGAERELVEEVRSAGQEVATALDALDGRIAALARDADPAERARLEERLSELTERESTGGDENRRMRQLVEEQLGLARSLAGQLDAAKERRSRLWDLLKTLWLQVANLKARAAEDAFHSGEISAKIRAISDDIQRYVEASDETVRLLSESAD